MNTIYRIEFISGQFSCHSSLANIIEELDQPDPDED